jgi:hypothetical protein
MHFDGKVHFVTGIRKDAWEKIKSMLDASTCWDATRHDVTEDRIFGTVRVQGNTCIDKRKVWSDIINEGAFDIRVSLAVERPAEPPRTSMKSFVRHKDRHSYAWRCWRFDLTHVSSNAPQHVDEADGVFEVELEFSDPLNLVLVPLTEVTKWGHDLMRELLAHITVQ